MLKAQQYNFIGIILYDCSLNQLRDEREVNI